MNISVRRNVDGGSNKNLPMILSNILNKSEESFEAASEEYPAQDITIKKRSSPANFSQVLNSMSIANIWWKDSPIIVETSILSWGVAIKEEVNPFEPEDIKLAFKGKWNLLIGIILLMLLVTSGAMLGPVTMYIKPAKHPLIKAVWRTQSNFVYSITITCILYFVKRNEMSFRRDHSLRTVLNSLWGTFFNFAWYVSLMIGISMTITSHAMVMYSSTGIYTEELFKVVFVLYKK